MEEKRYQVFVSSTYDDLREERSIVMQTLLKLDCFPAGMELFPATDESQWSIIKKVIDESDYYIVIIGGRYGSIDTKSNAGYTEMEYDYAIKSKKPILAFTYFDIGSLPNAKCESTDAGKEKLQSFINKIEKNRHRKTWSNASELASEVMMAMVTIKKQYPAIGWMKANKITSEDAMQEILRLNKENTELTKKISDNNLELIEENKKYAQGKDVICFEVITDIEHSKEKGKKYEIVKQLSDFIELTWDELFLILSDNLIISGESGEDIEKLIELLNNYVMISFRKSNLKNTEINLGYRERIGSSFVTYDMFKILRQFKILDYIVFFEEIEDSGYYSKVIKKIKLTEYGEEYYYHLTAVLRQ